MIIPSRWASVLNKKAFLPLLFNSAILSCTSLSISSSSPNTRAPVGQTAVQAGSRPAFRRSEQKRHLTGWPRSRSKLTDPKGQKERQSLLPRQSSSSQVTTSASVFFKAPLGQKAVQAGSAQWRQFLGEEVQALMRGQGFSPLFSCRQATTQAWHSMQRVVSISIFTGSTPRGQPPEAAL